MSEPHVVSALVKKRTELTGQIEHTQTQLRQLIIDLDNLDATIRLFVPDIDLEDIKPKPMPPRHAAYKGEISRLVLTMLRQSEKPLTTKDLVLHVMAEKGLNTADKCTVRLMSKRVGACLRHWRTKGVINSDQGPGQYMLWQLNTCYN